MSEPRCYRVRCDLEIEAGDRADALRVAGFLVADYDVWLAGKLGGIGNVEGSVSVEEIEP